MYLEFFQREMELKRKYKEIPSSTLVNDGFIIKENNKLMKTFSITGWYYYLSKYGEDLRRPALTGIMIVFLSTFFLVAQSNPDLNPAIITISLPIRFLVSLII
jgi:hypothetical protein